MCNAYDTPTAVQCVLVSEIQDIIRHEMTWFPSIVACEDDVTHVVLGLLPDPNSYESARDYLDDVRVELDPVGSMMRESIEGLFTGIIYTADAHKFVDDYSAECDEAAMEYGIFHDVSECESLSEVITRVADYGGAHMISKLASDLCWLVDGLLDRIEDEIVD